MTYVSRAASVPGVQAIAATGGTLTLPFSGFSASARVLLTGNTAITVGPGTAGVDQVLTIDLVQGGAGGFVPSFPGVSWAGGIAPSFNTVLGKVDTIQMRAAGLDLMGWPVSMGRVPLVAAVPVAPGSATVTPGVNQNSITAAAVTAYPAVTGYTIYAGASAGAESATPIAANVALPYVETGLTPGVARFYKVAAVNSVGTGAQSTEASGTPLSSGAAPVAPASITVTPGTGQNSVSVPAVTASPAVTGYSIYRGTAAGAESGTPIATNVALPYTDSAVTAGTAYFYKVAAVNSVGTGAQSPEGSGTPTVAVAHAVQFTGGTTPPGNFVQLSPTTGAMQPGANRFVLDVKGAYSALTSATLVSKWTSSTVGVDGGGAPAGAEWLWWLNGGGQMQIVWTTTGGSVASATATAADTIGTATGWRRVDVTPTTGAVNFYQSTDGTTWTQVGATVTASPVGAVVSTAAGTADAVRVGRQGDASLGVAGRLYEWRMTVAGTVVFDATVTASAVVDSVSGNTWTLAGSNASIV